MGKVTVLMIAVIAALSTPLGSSRQPDSRQPDMTGPQLQVSDKPPTEQVSALHVTIATVGPMLGPPTDRYRVGEQVPITIGMTNTSSQPDYVCISGDLYQDLPSLKKNGQLIPYAKWQSDLLRDVQKELICQNENLPEGTLLNPNEPTVVDFLVLVDDSRFSTGAVSWYDPLTPGVYELTVQRRIGCCDGPMLESNKISFQVVP